MKKSFNNI